MENNTLEVRDLSLAAFLMMKGNHLIEIIWDAPRRCRFIFEGDQSIFEDFYRSEIPKHSEFVRICKRKLMETEKEHAND